MAAHVRTYCPGVRVGNWNEDLQLEEDTLKDFLDKREKGQLLIQRSGGVMGKMLNAVQLSTTSSGNVLFGDVVMVLNKGNPDRTVYGIGQYPRDDSVLAIHLPEVDGTDEGPATLIVTGTKNLSPCFRTAFKIMPADDYGVIGRPLLYGQHFSLMTAAEGSGNLYLFSDRVLFNRCTDKARHQVAQLVPEKSFKTTWQILHKNPQIRLETEGAPVVANEECIIQHCKTEQNLCVEETCFTSTFFGNEYEISAHTKLDSHKADMPVTRWSLVMAVAGDPVYPMALDSTGTQTAADVQPSVPQA